MLKPLRDEVFVTVHAPGERKSGIIVIGAKNSTNTATVAAVGPGFQNPKGVVEKIPLKKGDKVFFPKGTGMRIEHDDEEFIMIRFGDIMGIIEE